MLQQTVPRSWGAALWPGPGHTLRACSEECCRVLVELICHGHKDHDYHSLAELLFRVP